MEGKRPNGGAPYGGPPRKRGPGADDDIDDLIADFVDDEDVDDMQPPEEAEEVDLGEAGRNWVRPPVADFNPASTSIGAWEPSARGS